MAKVETKKPPGGFLGSMFQSPVFEEDNEVRTTVSTAGAVLFSCVHPRFATTPVYHTSALPSAPLPNQGPRKGFWQSHGEAIEGPKGGQSAGACTSARP